MVREIEDYVKYAKFYRFSYSRADLQAILVDSHKEAMNSAPEKTRELVEFQLKVEPSVPEIEADPVALQEAFAQIMINAYEAMPKGGRLIVRIGPYGPGALVSVADTGAGISSDQIKEIFSPFVTSKTSGAGMGLSKVYLLVEEHGGSINVESSPGAGTTFEVLLPVDRRTSGPFLFHSRSREGTA
jgi:signal transduction histidine kinase